MTYQVAMIGSDGWVLVSDGRASVTGGPPRPTAVRTSYDTEKIRYQGGIATAPFGDETAGKPSFIGNWRNLPKKSGRQNTNLKIILKRGIIKNLTDTR